MKTLVGQWEATLASITEGGGFNNTHESLLNKYKTPYLKVMGFVALLQETWVFAMCLIVKYITSIVCITSIFLNLFEEKTQH